MADYIDRAALTEQLLTLATRYAALGREKVAQDYNWVITALDSAPAADVAEVVQCKYCAYLGAPLSGGCYDCKKYMLPYCRPDDFCSYGERRKGGDDNVSD